jgi:hypothetical protein
MGIEKLTKRDAVDATRRPSIATVSSNSTVNTVGVFAELHGF